MPQAQRAPTGSARLTRSRGSFGKLQGSSVSIQPELVTGQIAQWVAVETGHGPVRLPLPDTAK
jgi:hypothetical protein